MKYMGMPVALWAVFTRSFRKNLETCFGLNATEAKEVTRKAKVRYKKIIRELPEFEKEDRFKMNIVSCAMIGAFVLSMPKRPDVKTLTNYYRDSSMTPLVSWFFRQSGKLKFSEKDRQQMQKTARLKAADRNPFSWNMDYFEYPDGSGYSVRPSERGHGYAKEMLRQLLPKAGALGIQKFLITCKVGNLASEKTILANGGVFDKIVDGNGEEIKRFWITIDPEK